MINKNEEDKCFGIAGMAIGISIWHGEDKLYRINIDDSEGKYIALFPDETALGELLHPKDAWNNSLKEFQMTVGMLIANMMSCSIGKKQLEYSRAKKALYKTVAEEGKRSCQLEEDEVRRLFDETYVYLDRVFENESVHEIARRFAKKLQESRTLSNYEIKDLLGMIEDF